MQKEHISPAQFKVTVNIHPLVAALVWFATSEPSAAVDRFVPAGGTPSYGTIQAALTASQGGDVVRVQPGLYRESISFPAVDVTLMSVDPNDSNIVKATVIQGDGKKSVVRFDNGRTTNTLFTGFSVRGGGGQLGGGIYCEASSPRII